MATEGSGVPPGGPRTPQGRVTKPKNPYLLQGSLERSRLDLDWLRLQAGLWPPRAAEAAFESEGRADIDENPEVLNP